MSIEPHIMNKSILWIYEWFFILTIIDRDISHWIRQKWKLGTLRGCIFSEWAIGQQRKNLIIEILYGELNGVGLDLKLHLHLVTFICKPFWITGIFKFQVYMNQLISGLKLYVIMAILSIVILVVISDISKNFLVSDLHYSIRVGRYSKASCSWFFRVHLDFGFESQLQMRIVFDFGKHKNI